nr:hypothetical protein [Tanacetum cinerariifolium]
MKEAMLPRIHHDFLYWGTSNRDAKTKYNTNLSRLLPKQFYSSCIVDWGMLNKMGCAEEIEAMLKIKEFARRLGLYHSAEIGDGGFEVYFQGGLRSDENFNAREYWLNISSEEELHLSRSLTSNIRCLVLKVPDIQKKGQNQSKTDKTEHRMEKRVKVKVNPKKIENHFTFDHSSINNQTSARFSIHASLGHDPGSGGGGGGSVDVVLVVTVKLEETSANAVRALKKFVLCRVSTEI